MCESFHCVLIAFASSISLPTFYIHRRNMYQRSFSTHNLSTYFPFFTCVFFIDCVLHWTKKECNSASNFLPCGTNNSLTWLHPSSTMHAYYDFTSFQITQYFTTEHNPYFANTTGKRKLPTIRYFFPSYFNFPLQNSNVRTLRKYKTRTIIQRVKLYLLGW